MLPMLFWIRVKNRDTSFKFFLPLILLYLLMIIPIVLCAIGYTFMLLAPQSSRQARVYMMFVLKSPRLISAAKGTEIIVHSNDTDIKMFVK
jgi:preprotein translocase subunit YajC